MFDNMTITELLKLFAPLILVQLILAVFCLFRLTQGKVKFIPKWAWALVIVLGSTLGPIIYLLLGRERD